MQGSARKRETISSAQKMFRGGLSRILVKAVLKLLGRGQSRTTSYKLIGGAGFRTLEKNGSQVTLRTKCKEKLDFWGRHRSCRQLEISAHTGGGAIEGWLQLIFEYLTLPTTLTPANF